jgi:hypothetical protein
MLVQRRGICSNFPIHFRRMGAEPATFDQPHHGRGGGGPQRPWSADGGARPNPRATRSICRRPSSRAGPLKSITACRRFWAACRYSLDYRDTAARAADYRERVVRSLSAEEGLNLDGSSCRPRRAAVTPGSFDFCAFCGRLACDSTTGRAAPSPERPPRDGLPTPEMAHRGRGLPYPRSDEWCRRAQALLDALADAHRRLTDEASRGGRASPSR